MDSSPTTQTTSNEIIHKNSKHMEHKNKYENMKKKTKREKKKPLCWHNFKRCRKKTRNVTREAQTHPLQLHKKQK